MKAIYAAAAAALLLAPAIVAAQAPGAERPPAVAAPAPPPPLPPPTNAPEIRVDAVDFLNLPKDMYVGEIAGVAVNKQGHVFVFQRGNTSGPAYGAAAAQLLEFDQAGTFVREIGKNLYAWSYAHAVRVDPEGNIWAADKGSDMVIKFNPAGKVVMVFGRKSEASDENAKPIERVNPPRPAIDGQFRQVTDMTWDSKGNTYISDGYINSRVAKVSKEGQWLKSWGSPGREPGQFNTLHTIASDAQDRIYVGDRGNQRIQVFNTEGELLKIIRINVPFPPNAPVAIGNQPAPGQGAGTAAPFAPWAICITPPNAAGKQFLFMADSYPGRVYKMDLDGKVIGWFGGNGKQLKQFGWIHEMACPDENTVFAAELLNWRLQKLTLH